MKMIKSLQKLGVLRFIWNVFDTLMPSFIKTIYFNFHYLPFSQARKLPIKLRHCSIRRQKGEVVIDSSEVTYGMIEIGHKMNPWCPKRRCTLNLNGGKIIFHGRSFFGQGACITVLKNGLLEVGDRSTFASSMILEVWNKVVFGAKVHAGWGVTIVDTDLAHPLNASMTIFESI